MTDLSPAAQTVLDAFLNGYICNPGHNVAFESDRNGLAAALRAAADQVVPEQGCQIYGTDLGKGERTATSREEILAIAAELEVNAQ
jgi:propanediol dehydratase small subunit